MRIRKRAVPLPLSLLSPVPFSDPHLHLVQLSTSPPSDPPDLRHDRPTVAASTPQPPPLKACEDEKMNKEQKEDPYNTSKQSDSGAVADSGVKMVSLPLSPSNQTKVEGRWCDGDKTIPLKKRRASFEMNGMVVTGECKMKSKTNKNCPLEEDPEKADDYGDDDDDYEEDDNSDSDNIDNNKRKRKRKVKKSSMGAKTKTKTKKKTKKKKGGSLMEGSRCSRVNGRGWRCMQPTLVGYSLCEHHLGKGRLRSMSSVRARSNKIITTNTLLSQLPPHPDPDQEEKSCNIAETPKQEESVIHDYDDDDDDDEKRPIPAGNGRKRTRIGMVKARSLSSLLCLPNTTTTSVVQIGATSANQAT